MVLYDPSILDQLPAAILTNLHRSLCKIRKNRWNTAKLRSWYYMLPRQVIEEYHRKVIVEMLNRNWKPNLKWLESDPEEDAFELGNAELNSMQMFFELNPLSIAQQQKRIDKWNLTNSSKRTLRTKKQRKK